MRVTFAFAILFAATAAHAHVGPSKDDNNRYLKLTPEADRVRLAYTIFFGDVPGARLRTSLDTDGNGEISEAEAQAFGNKLGDQVRAAIDVDVDNNQRSLGWEQIVVGMGSPKTRAGAFSVDLVANLCLAPGSTHAVILRDRFVLTNPGETEVKLEDARGIKITSSKLGGSSDRDVKFVGPGGPLADEGVTLAFEVTSDAAQPSSACATPADAEAEARKRIPAVLVIGSAAAIAFLLAVVVTLIRRRG